jgi:hypothetical protein
MLMVAAILQPPKLQIRMHGHAMTGSYGSMAKNRTLLI